MSRRQKRLRNMAGLHGQLKVLAERRLAETRSQREQTLASIRSIEILSGSNPALDDLLTANAVKTLARLQKQAEELALECATRRAIVVNCFVRSNLAGKLAARVGEAEYRRSAASEAADLTASFGFASLPQEIAD